MSMKPLFVFELDHNLPKSIQSAFAKKLYIRINDFTSFIILKKGPQLFGCVLRNELVLGRGFHCHIIILRYYSLFEELPCHHGSIFGQKMIHIFFCNFSLLSVSCLLVENDSREEYWYVLHFSCLCSARIFPNFLSTSSRNFSVIS